MIEDYLTLTPLNWRKLTYWALPALASEQDFVCSDARLHFRRLEVLIDPSYGYYYRLERTSDHTNSNCWRLEAHEYGNDAPALIVSQIIPSLASATFAELVAAMGVLSSEATEPWGLEQRPEEWEALQTRWNNWLRSPADWMQATPVKALATIK